MAMNYLLVCEHKNMIVNAGTADAASMLHECSRCSDLRDRRLRIYRATQKDLEIVTGAEVQTKRRYKAINQLDFTKP